MFAFTSSKRLNRLLMRPFMARGYYETIHGIARDQKALVAARAAVAGRGDGRVSRSDADAILATLEDWQGVTAVEFSTAFLILREFKFTPEASAYFIDRLALATPVK